MRFFLITSTKGIGGVIPSCINMVGHFSIDAAPSRSSRKAIIIIIIIIIIEEEEVVVFVFLKI